ncbi:uncharacterized protein BDR25DRAFT_363128, partial [Lindgomyces ingoldianus]
KIKIYCAKVEKPIVLVIVVVVVVLLSWSAGAGLSLGRELQSLRAFPSKTNNKINSAEVESCVVGHGCCCGCWVRWWSAGGALVAGAAMKIKIHRAVRVAAKHHHICGAMVKSSDLGQKEERKGGRIQRDAQSRRTRPDPQQSQGDRL